MKEKIFLIITMFSIILLFTSLVLAKHPPREYQYNIGKANESAVAMASNGEKIEVTGNGTFVIESKTITGSGRFLHKDKNGNILGNGTWTAKSLLSFDSWSSVTSQELTKGPEGGRAFILIRLSPNSGGPALDGILMLEHVLGKSPKNSTEGIRLNIKLEPGLQLNFFKKIGGQTLFIRK